MDWEGLAGSLSPEALAALREHMEGKASSTNDTTNVLNDENHMRNNARYKEMSYWDDRFKEEKSYDWLLSFEQIRELILPHIPSTASQILVIGCGNSFFSRDLYDAGYTNITNIDYSQIVIDAMQQQYQESHPLMQWKCMDMTFLEEFTDNSFDVIIDKAAMDAIVVDEGDVWSPNIDTISTIDRMCLGLSRILVSGGIHMQISFSQPHFRSKYLFGSRACVDEAVVVDPYKTESGESTRYRWSLSSQTIECGGCLPYFFYVMIKL